MADALTILAIDDGEVDQNLYKRTLKATAHTLVQAFNGEDGLAKASEAKPDLILLDYNMPDLSGLEVLERLVTPSGARIPIIMLTGGGDESVAVEAMKAGASDYLVKDTAGNYLHDLPHVISRVHAAFEERNRVRRLNALNSAILGTVADGILGIGSDGGILFANPAAERMLLSSTGGLVGRQIKEFLYQTGPQDAWENHPLSQPHGASDTFSRESDFLQRSDGSCFPAAYNASALDFEESGSSGWVLAFQDITERKTAEEQLRRHKEQLEVMVQERTVDLLLARDAAEAASKAKSTLLTNISQQLRAPVDDIQHFSGIMRGDPEANDKQREWLGIIYRSCESLAKLVNSISDVTKIEAERQKAEIPPFNLGDLVREVADRIQLRAKEKGVQLVVDYPFDVPQYIKADRERIRQIMYHLADDAVKFAKAGNVTVRAGVKQSANPHLRMEFEHCGPGIPPEDQKNPSQAFARLCQIGAQTGAGLGLAIARQFVEFMGGTIGVTNEPGKDTVFRAEVPVEVAEAYAGEAAGAGEIVGLAPGTPRYRVLIAEAEPANRLLLRQLMERVGFEVKLAASGEECVKLFLEWRPHLIWMDRHMPAMDGMEATRCIRMLPAGQEVKIVAVTTSELKHKRQEMVDAGMDDMVCKPYRFDEIYAALARQLDVKYVYKTAVKGQAA